jgi:hypothetical protein
MNPEEISQEIVTEIEKDKIVAFCEDKTAFEAVKRYILAVCYKQGVLEKGRSHNPRINWAMNLSWGAIDPKGMPRTDEELGQNLRAMTFAVQLIESGFKEMADLKKPEKLEDEVTNVAE